jgi:hypothetical protein
MPDTARVAALEVFPNPASDVFTVKFTEKWRSQACELRVSDLLGRVFMTQPFTSETAVSGSSLPPGLYVITLHDAQQQVIGAARLVRN